MAVRIRLRRMGRKKQPHYRVVVADSAKARDGRFVESLGYYRPLTEPARLVLDLDRVDYWIGQGAIPSDTVRSLVEKARRGGDDSVAVGEKDTEAEKARQAEELAARRQAEKEAAAAAKAAEEAAKAEAKAAEEAEKAEAEAAAQAAEAEAEADAGTEAEVEGEADVETEAEAAGEPTAEAEAAGEAEAAAAAEPAAAAEEPEGESSEEETKEGS